MNKTTRPSPRDIAQSAVDKAIMTVFALAVIAFVAFTISFIMGVPVAKGDDCPNGVCPQRAPQHTVVPQRARAPEPFYSNYPRYRYWNNPYIKIQPQKKPQGNSGRYRKISDTKCPQEPTPAVETIVVKRVDFIKTHTANVIESTDQGNVLVDTATVHFAMKFIDGKLETIEAYDGKLEVVFRGKEWWLFGKGFIVISPGRTVTETATIRESKPKTKNKDA